MNGRQILACIVTVMMVLPIWAQELSIQLPPKIDSVWYKNVDEDSEPDPLSCEANSIGYFRLKYTDEIVIDEFKKDSVKTRKEDWEDEDEEAYEKKYNEEKKKELEGLEDEYIEEDKDIDELAENELKRYISHQF